MNTYQQAINEMLDEEENNINELHENLSWRIDSLELAVWADSKVHEDELKIFEIEQITKNNIAVLEAKIEKLRSWQEQRIKPYKEHIQFLKEHLHLYHKKINEEERLKNEELIAKGKKPKTLSGTIKLPYRELKRRKQADLILINGKEASQAKSDERFVSYLKETYPELVRVSEEALWGDFKKVLKVKEINGKEVFFDKNGEVVEFITTQSRPDNYDWKLKLEDDLNDEL